MTEESSNYNLDLLVSRRHEVTSLVYQKWIENEGCSPETALAIHYFDTTYNILEQYIIEGAEDLETDVVAHQHYSHVSSLSLCYDDFMNQFMGQNKVVLITELVDHWKARKEWCKIEPATSPSNYNIVPDMPTLVSRYGESQVEVDPHNAVQSYNKTRIQIPLSDFTISNKGYVKDFHFRSSYPEEAKRLIPTPHLFTDDWLNDYATSKKSTEPSTETSESYSSNNNNLASDYHFMYLGGEGTSTHLHADVLGSYSWSANVCGKKTWRFLHPKFFYMLRDVFGRKVSPDFSMNQDNEEEPGTNEITLSYEDGDYWQFPLLKKAPHFKVVQEAGEVLFVPSEWYHTVVNNKDTLSINANWFNRHNLKFIFNRLRRLQVAVENEKKVEFGETDSVIFFMNDVEHDATLKHGNGPLTTNEEVSNNESQQYGKPPFDIKDFINLLSWKVDKSLNELLAVTHVEKTSSYSDIQAIHEVAMSLSLDTLFSDDIRTESGSIVRKCSSLLASDSQH